jgi:hypothetical protein
LPEFQKYLLKHKLVPEKNVPYLDYWVSRYLSFAKRGNMDATSYLEASALEFIENLRSTPRLQKWQPRFHMKTRIAYLKWIPAFAGKTSYAILLINS